MFCPCCGRDILGGTVCIRCGVAPHKRSGSLSAASNVSAPARSLAQRGRSAQATIAAAQSTTARSSRGGATVSSPRGTENPFPVNDEPSVFDDDEDFDADDFDADDFDADDFDTDNFDTDEASASNGIPADNTPPAARTQQSLFRDENTHKDDLPEYPLKWYYFLIYFLLFASALVNGIAGLNQLFSIGDSYTPGYTFFSALVSLFFAVYAIVARQKLSQKLPSGPKMLVTMYVLNGVYTIVDNILRAAVFGSDFVLFSFVTAAGSFVFALINHNYFKKRVRMFGYF